MKLNLTFLEILVFFLAFICFYTWLRYGRRIRRWLRDYFRRRRGPRQLKPKAPDDCPACNTLQLVLPCRPKPEVVPWMQVKSPRGRPKTIDSNGYACMNLPCGSCRTSRYGTPLYWLKTPLTHITMVMTALAEGVDLLPACVSLAITIRLSRFG